MKTAIGYIAGNVNKQVKILEQSSQEVLYEHLTGERAGSLGICIVELIKEFCVKDPEEPPKADLWNPE